MFVSLRGVLFFTEKGVSPSHVCVEDSEERRGERGERRACVSAVRQNQMAPRPIERQHELVQP